MATSTLLQYLEPTDGAGVANGITPSNRRQTETFIASETLAVGDLVSLDLAATGNGVKSLKIMKANTTTGADKCFVGVVLESVESDGALTAGSSIRVVIRGIVPALMVGKNDQNVNAVIAVGDPIALATTAGNAALLVTAGFSEVGIAVEATTSAASAALKDIYVISRF